MLAITTVSHLRNSDLTDYTPKNPKLFTCMSHKHIQTHTNTHTHLYTDIHRHTQRHTYTYTKRKHTPQSLTLHTRVSKREMVRSRGEGTTGYIREKPWLKPFTCSCGCRRCGGCGSRSKLTLICYDYGIDCSFRSLILNFVENRGKFYKKKTQQKQPTNPWDSIDQRLIDYRSISRFMTSRSIDIWLKRRTPVGLIDWLIDWNKKVRRIERTLYCRCCSGVHN